MSSKSKKKIELWKHLFLNRFSLVSLLLWLFLTVISVPYLIRFISIINPKDATIRDLLPQLMILVSLGLVSVALSSLFKFLVNDKERKKDTYISASSLHERSETEKNIQSTINEALSKNPELLNVEKTIYEKLTTNLENTLINKLDERFKNNVKTEFIRNSLITELVPLTKNVEIYIDRVQRNAIVNLFIGILGTITAIAILAFAILTNKTFSDFKDFAIHFLPRFTFVIFIQLFAFFFLRLYKNNLEDAKYFQNELTNLTAKSSAIKICYLLGNTEKIYEILKELALIERNFKLLKEETTIGLQKGKLESDSDKLILEQLKDILSKYELKK